MPAAAGSGRPELSGRPARRPLCRRLHVRADGARLRYTTIVIDAFAGTIVGWGVSASKETAFVQRAVNQACTLRSMQQMNALRTIRTWGRKPASTGGSNTSIMEVWEWDDHPGGRQRLRGVR